MTGLGADVWISIRRLRSAPVFTTFAVVTLALGIGATTAIYSVIYAAVLRPPDIKDADRVANLYHMDPRRGASGPSFRSDAEISSVISVSSVVKTCPFPPSPPFPLESFPFDEHRD